MQGKSGRIRNICSAVRLTGRSSYRRQAKKGSAALLVLPAAEKKMLRKGWLDRWVRNEGREA